LRVEDVEFDFRDNNDTRIAFVTMPPTVRVVPTVVFSVPT
jgi:hypothetical protein